MFLFYVSIDTKSSKFNLSIVKYEMHIYTSHESVSSLGHSADSLLGGQDGETDLLEEVQFIYICCSTEL